jgi:tryptophan halogenase
VEEPVGGYTAAFLSHNNPNIKITIVDKEVGCPVNIGEATILNFGPFMEMCGFYIEDWFINVDATYKSGILFPNWVTEGKSVWHPFYMNPIFDEKFSLHDAWCKNKSYDFVEYALPMYKNSMCNTIDRNELTAYAFHIDCGKLVEFIKNKLKNKINFIQSEVINLEKDNNKLKKVFLKNFK